MQTSDLIFTKRNFHDRKKSSSQNNVTNRYNIRYTYKILKK